MQANQPNIARYTFSKAEKLCNKGLINDIFLTGSSFLQFPLKVIYKLLPGPAPSQVMISIPKKKFRKAVIRNLLKRRIREGYRKNKYILPSHAPKSHYAIIFVYVGHEPVSTSQLEEKIILSLQRIAKGHE